MASGDQAVKLYSNTSVLSTYLYAYSHYPLQTAVTGVAFSSFAPNTVFTQSTKNCPQETFKHTIKASMVGLLVPSSTELFPSILSLCHLTI